jgi:hypothetical protein
MLLSPMVRKAVKKDIEVWPAFLSKCRCHLERDDSALQEALVFVRHVFGERGLVAGVRFVVETTG